MKSPRRKVGAEGRKSDTSLIKVKTSSSTKNSTSEFDEEQKKIEDLKNALKAAQFTENGIMSQVYALENQISDKIKKMKLNENQNKQTKDIEKEMTTNYQLRNKILTIYNERNIKIENSKKELSDLKFRLKGIEDQRNHKEQEIDQLQAQANEMNERLQEIDHSMNELKCTQQTLAHQVELAQQQVRNKEKEKQQLIAEKENLQKELENLRAVVEDHRKTNTDTINELNSKIENLKSETEETKQNIKIMTDKCATAESNIADLNEQIANDDEIMRKILETMKFYTKEIQANEFHKT